MNEPTEDEILALWKSLSKESRRLCGISSMGTDSITAATRACVKAKTHEFNFSANSLLRFCVTRTALGRAVHELDQKFKTQGTP